jgi:hypothetical protein
MEKMKNYDIYKVLLRMDAYSEDPVDAQAQNNYSDDEEDLDIEEPYRAIAHPAFELAFSNFMELIEDYEIFYQNDAISNEFEERIEPNSLLSMLIKGFSAEKDIESITAQIQSYSESFKNAMETLKEMEDKGTSEQEIRKTETELFSKIVIKFNKETEDFGNATYDFAIKRFYMDLMMISNMYQKRSMDIFDFFGILGDNPEYAKTIHEELKNNIIEN